MLRTILIASLGALALCMSLGSAAAPPAPCPNTIGIEPVVVFSRIPPFTGGPLGGGGPTTTTLTVYNSGLVVVANATEPGIDSEARATHVAPALARQLLLDLSALGSGTVCDGPPSPIESPIHTLTVLRDATDARAHTFSWRVSLGVYGPIHDRLRSFVQIAFPTPFPGF